MNEEKQDQPQAPILALDVMEIGSQSDTTPAPETPAPEEPVKDASQG